MSNSAALSSCRDTLAASVIVAQRLRAALACPSQIILHRSHWRCLASSYYVVTQALIVLLERAGSVLGPLEQETMCRMLTAPLHALHQAVQEGETCMQESLPSTCNSTHSWLLEKALKLGMSTDVVDLHLHHLLWTSSVVREQILRFAPIDGMELVISEQTRDLCEIWTHVDAQDDFISARSLLNRIIGEQEGETCQLASFILQKLSCAETLWRTTDSDDLPPFLWVNPEDLTRNPDILGVGGYGKVHEAVWLGGRFAVKDFFYVDNNVFFGREAKIQARLRHPNVIPLVCCTKNPRMNRCSLLMELMHQDLRVLMMQNLETGMETPFPLLHAVDLMLQIAKGMEYLHSDDLRIIHRDLKSSNVLVSFSSRAGVNSSYADVVSPHVHLKVADFGMSKAKYASSRFTSRPVGATPWRAPEVFEANPEDEGEGDHPNARYTNKADVYSFGLVCYEILTGKSPFEGTQVRRRVLSGERPMLPLHCPAALSSYIRRCWHADPDQRPTFTQICRMLRYFKACIFFQDQDHDHNAAEYHDWLLHPLSTIMCAHIDDMLQSLVQPFSGIIRPQLLVIPLEMYCCRVVLQLFRDKIEVADQISPGLVCQQFRDKIEVADQISAGKAAGIHQGSSSTLEGQRSGVGLEESRRTGKGYFNGPIKWLRKLSCLSGTHPVKSELRDALGLVGDFTYKELCVATNNFSYNLGGLGTFYRGVLVDGRRVAVKVQDYRQTMVQELRIVSQLRHRNIVPLFGWCQEQGKLLIVYEYMPNGNLGHHIFEKNKNVFGWSQRYKVVGQLAAALKYLHQDSGYKQIVHRGVKTSNILLDSEWNARLGNWGAAILLDKDNNPSEEDFQGTRGFLAPEVVRALGNTAASDIFSFGMTVLEIATGRRANRKVGVYVCLLVWVWELYEKGELMQVSDVRLAGNFDELEMKRLLELGLVCTNEEQQARPSIEEVLMILSTALEMPPIFIPQARHIIKDV